MYAFIGPENIDKTTPLIQFTYDFILDNANPSSYAIFFTSKSSKFFNDMVFGKYDSVNKLCLDRVHIKFIEKYEDLISFLYELTLVSDKNYPSIICFDRINLFINIVRFKFK